MRYSNFCIWIGWQAGKALVQVRPSDAVYGMWEPMEGSLDLSVAMKMRNGFRYRQLGSVEMTWLGTMLFEALLPSGVVRDLYQDSRALTFSKGYGLRMRLHIAAPELDALPWELLYNKDEGGFLVLDPRFSIVRTPHIRGAKLPIKGEVRAFPLRIVGAFPSPVDMPYLDTPGEQAAIDSAVKKVGIKPEDVKREDVKREERDQGSSEGNPPRCQRSVCMATSYHIGRLGNERTRSSRFSLWRTWNNWGVLPAKFPISIRSSVGTGCPTGRGRNGAQSRLAGTGLSLP